MGELRYFGLCKQSIKCALIDDSSKPRHFWFAEEGDFGSRIYYEILKDGKNADLIRPYKSCRDTHATIHCQFPFNLLQDTNDRAYMDLAIVGQTMTTVRTGQAWEPYPRVTEEQEEAGKRFHEHKHRLIGIIEVKTDVGKTFASDIVRIRKLLTKFPEAWGIMVVMYSWGDIRNRRATEGINALQKMKEESHLWNRFEFITEYSDKRKPWEDLIEHCLGQLAGLRVLSAWVV